MSDPIPLRADMSATRPDGGLSVQVDGVDKRFGERVVLSNTSLRLAAGQFGAIVGRSGCGKSTLLRLVAGLDAPDAGRVRLDGRPVAQCLDDVRIMFQDPRLLPWKTVHQNVMLGLNSPHASEMALQALHDVALADRAAEWPSRLSGGQRQRVALARALVHRPKLLLLDEPLGALDALTRLEMHRLIEHLWRSHGFTALLVTHDVAEAVALADRVLLVEQGQVTMDEAVRLARPRERASAARVALEARVLERVLQPPPPAIGAADGVGVGVG